MDSALGVRHRRDAPRAQVRVDSVDGLPNRDLPLSVSDLGAVVGPEAARQLLSLPARFGRSCGDSEGWVDRSRSTVVGVFARRYSADTLGSDQPWTSFHFDNAATTVNVALSADADVHGGRLLGMYAGGVHVISRDAGEATVHSSRLLHGVTRIRGGTRYSLIMFFAAGAASRVTQKR